MNTWSSNWWDLAVEIAVRRGVLTGRKHRVTWDRSARAWRVTPAVIR